jgi:hypothetical protein
MATKNKKKKSTQKNTIVFNKKNTLALADSIYSDKAGVVTLLKLCEGTLKNGKDGGRTTHCAVGEAYFTFVNPDMSKVVKKKTYVSKYDATITADGATAAVIDALVEVAVLKKDTEDNRKKLAEALDSAVDENDDAYGSDISSFAERAERVATAFREQVAPLLK